MYDWDDKHDICYRLYVEEQKPVREVQDYLQSQFAEGEKLPRCVAHVYRMCSERCPIIAHLWTRAE